MLSFVAPPLIAGFQTLHPEVTFRFVEDSQFNLEHAMLAGTIDLSIVYDFGLGAALERRRLYNAVAYVLLCPSTPSPTHGAGGPRRVRRRSLHSDRLLPGRDEHLFAAVGLTPNVVHRTTNFEFVRALVAHNLGYAGARSASNNVTTEGLPFVVRPIANPVPHLTVALAWPANLHLHRRVRAFVDFSVETFKDGYHA